MAGGNGPGSNDNQLKSPRCLHVRANGLLHVCDYGNERIQQWDIGANSGSTVTDHANGDSPNGLVVDSGGGVYLADNKRHYVLEYSDKQTSSVAAGEKGNPGSATDKLEMPSGLVLDDNSNLYVVDTGNNRVMRWNAKGTTHVQIIHSSTIAFTDIAMSLGVPGLFYLSSKTSDLVVSWKANEANPIKSFLNVNNSNPLLNEPRGIKLDQDENIYVADSGNKRVVMFCAGSTMGRVIVNKNPSFSSLVDIGLDSQRNIYIVDETDHKVVRFDLN